MIKENIMTSHKYYNHLLHTIEVMVENTVDKIEKDTKRKISCKKGCSYCCYLLVEISWEEAVMLVDWLEAQHPKIKQELIDNIHRNAAKAREILSHYKHAKDYIKPYRDNLHIPIQAYDRYFYKNTIPCPFLYDGACSAYEARPTPCRLHMVTSPSHLCSSDTPDEVEGYEVPDEIEQLKENVVPITEAFFKDGHFGQLGIMVEAVLNSRKRYPHE